MGYINHHHKKANDNSVENENVSKPLDAFLKSIVVCVKIPSPNGTHNNGY